MEYNEYSTISCGECGTHNPFREFTHWFNIGIIIILVVGLVLGPYLICHRHKGEKGLWKKFYYGT